MTTTIEKGGIQRDVEDIKPWIADGWKIKQSVKQEKPAKKDKATGNKKSDDVEDITGKLDSLKQLSMFFF